MFFIPPSWTVCLTSGFVGDAHRVGAITLDNLQLARRARTKPKCLASSNLSVIFCLWLSPRQKQCRALHTPVKKTMKLFRRQGRSQPQFQVGLSLTEMDRSKPYRYDYPHNDSDDEKNRPDLRNSEYRRASSPQHHSIISPQERGTPTTTQKQQSYSSETVKTEGDNSESSYDSNMPPSKADEVELLVVPLRTSPHKDSDHDLERGERSSAKTNFLYSAASLKAISSCLLYSFCSVSMILANKSLASR